MSDAVCQFVNVRHSIRKWSAVFVLLLLNASSQDSLLISVAGMAVYTGFVFMPQHIMAILHYFEVVQWQGDPPSGLWLPVCPPTPHSPAVRRLPGSRDRHLLTDRVVAELSSSLKLIHGQRSKLCTMCSNSHRWCHFFTEISGPRRRFISCFGCFHL